MLLFDDRLLSWLPAQSRIKAEQFNADSAVAMAVMRQADDAVLAARQEHARAAAAAREQIAARPRRAFEPPPGAPPDVVAVYRPGMAKDQRERMEFEARMMEPVARAKRALDRAVEVHERAAARWQEFAFLGNAQSWLARMAQSRTRLVHRAGAVGRVDSLPDEIARIRREIMAIFDEWRAAEAAPAPADDYRARVIAEIQEVAARGAPSIDLRDRGPRPLGLAQRLALGLVPGGDGVSRAGDAGAAFWVWVHRDALIARVSAVIDAEAAAAGKAMSNVEREAAFRAIVERKLALEFLEEAAICAAAKQGMSIPRRRECDPRAVLEVIEA